MAKKPSKTKATATKTIHAAFAAMKAAGGELPRSEVHAAIAKAVEFNEWELGTYPNSGNTRWKSVFAFYSIDAVKAGYLEKNKGVWILTDDGDKAADQSAAHLLADISKKFNEWSVRNKKEKTARDVNAKVSDEQLEDRPISTYEKQISDYEADAAEGIRNHILRKSPGDFEKIVEVLLKAMGYFTHLTNKGRDGGVDIYAYSDPLGAESPRIKVQVKHQPNTALGVDLIRSMNGIIKGSEDVGLIVTSGWFSRDAEILSKEQNNHIELINFVRFIELWQEHYSKMNDEDRNMLPLHPIYFLGSNE
jgi:restriction system protein